MQRSPRVILSVLVASCATLAVRAQGVEFNRDIRPLLSDRCFKCHGFDAAARKADLRLDTVEGLTTPIDGRYPVVRGKPDESELIRRIESDDPDFAMPHKDSALSLSAAEKRLLRQWVEEGAKFEDHWAFVSPKAATPPRVRREADVENAIDRFVLSKLEKAGLEPAPVADRATLLRRVHLDLTGLPPTIEELDAFLSDTRPDAYERVVDRLLKSAAHGERMALMWLDAARYADTNGFHHDNIRTAWPYRDWVIRAFQENKPYDEFVVEQIAGDLLPGATDAQRIATAFSRMHNINDEGGALDAEYAVEAVCDRIETIATTYLGLTVGCARCHDHKYDPITQEDYYSLFAFFNSVDERGVYPANFEQARAYPARMLFMPDELKQRIRKAGDELERAIAAKKAAEPTFEAERLAAETALRERHGITWEPREGVEAHARSKVPLVREDDDSFFLKLPEGGDVPSTDVHSFTFESEATDLRLIRFEAMADPRLPKKSVGLVSHGNVVISRFRVEVESRSDPTTRREVPLVWGWADHEQQNSDHDLLNALASDDKDGKGWALAGHTEKSTRTAVLLAGEAFGFEGGSRVTVHVHYESRYPQHVAGRTRVTLGRARTSVAEEMPLRSSEWFAAGPFKAKSFAIAYDTRFGPEGVTRLDMERKFDGKKWRFDGKLQDGKAFPFSGANSAYYFGREIRTLQPTRISLSLGSDDAIRVFLDGKEILAKRVTRGVAPDQEKVDVEIPRGTHAIVVKIVNQAGPGGFYGRLEVDRAAPDLYRPVALLDHTDRDAVLQDRYATAWATSNSPTFAKLEAAVRENRARVKTLEAKAVPILVMSEREKPTPTFVLSRGRYDLADKKRPVTRRPPTLFGGALPEEAPQNRLGFARWLVQEDNPLTARVHVNRLWQMVFGTGIVATVENFGMQADWPSHPQLLDWLAVKFAKDWDGRALLRLIVTSATYRRSARPSAEARRLDPKNRLLAHFPRRRLAGEMIRDLALSASGLLETKIGGPSVRPYQPDGLWREVSIGGSSNTRIFEQDTGAALYRRSLYTFWKRTSPSPQMTTFDAPTREFCVVQRSVTNTPLQALVLWNDVQFLEAARVLAQRVLHEPTGSDDARIARLFRRCTGRSPGVEEQRILAATLADFRRRYREAPEDAKALLEQGEFPLPAKYESERLAAWMLLASTILSLDETVVRD